MCFALLLITLRQKERKPQPQNPKKGKGGKESSAFALLNLLFGLRSGWVAPWDSSATKSNTDAVTRAKWSG